MHLDKPANIIVCLGRTGSGKTSWVKQYTKGLPRVLYFDTMGEYPGQVVTTSKDLLDFLIKHHDKAFQVAFRPMDEDDKKAFVMACRAAWACSDLTFVAEEVDLYCSASWSPGEFRKLINYGRHRRVYVVGVARRAAEISRTLTANCTRLIVFYTAEQRDLAYLGSRLPSAEVEKLPQLQQLEFLDYTDQTSERKKIHFEKNIIFLRNVTSLTEGKKPCKVSSKAGKPRK